MRGEGTGSVADFDSFTATLSGDNTISLYQGNSGQCLDLKDGALPGSLQTWQCTPGNTNQVFTRTSAIKPTTTTTTTSSSATSTPPSTGGRRIYFNGDKTQCLTVGPATKDNGSPVGVSSCVPDGDRYISNQLWDVQRGTTAVKLSAGNFCLDFGTNPNANGVGAKLWTCYPGLTQQTFYYTNDNRVSRQRGERQM